MNRTQPVLGIDLGTTNTVMARVLADGSWECIPNQEGQEYTPSVVQIAEHGFCVGQAALDQAESHPETVILEVKRHMADPDWLWMSGDIWLRPRDISALILQKIQQDASARLKQDVRQVVISVPAHFSENQRQATVEAAQLAGLDPLRLINEPSAAALAYGYQDLPEDSLLFVMDLGGGTFDVSILQHQQQNLQVLATRGHAHLGGQDWDDLILHQAAAQFISEHGLDPLDDPHSHQRLRRKVIAAKHQLSVDQEVTFTVRFQQLTSKVTIQQDQLQQMAQSQLGQMEELCRLVLEDIHQSSAAIARVLLVGGATRMPMVQRLAQRLFPQAPFMQDYPEKAVAYGAALQGFLLLHQGTVPRPTMQTEGTIPQEIRTESDLIKEAHTAEFPQETTSPESKRPLYIGGSVQIEPDMALPIRLGVRDVNSHRLGLVVLDAQGRPLVDTLIERFSPLPYTHRATYFTAHDNQISLDLEIVEGESPYPEECIPLGTARIEGIPPRPAGQAIDVEFTYNVSGLLELIVRDVGTGKRYHQQVQSPHQHPKGAKQRVQEWLAQHRRK